ncbi:aquaporin NIP1-3-like isoform X2 [Phragmites australis]|uniref:aquaporin NIP1-3-like isoform X2 n=1 Tax=Phragmites australis TaxID=29695 RepID=UPI002D76F7CE|nr:aquaporin NIP1-3-like isoform X2 [Phragmites australis]
MAEHENVLQESSGDLEEGRGGGGGGGGGQARRENSELDGTGNRSMFSVQFAQKILAEFFGTYFLMFAGCAVVVVNQRTGGAVTLVGIGITWGFTVMVMVYSVGHISGAHLNPAVTIAFATCGRLSWKQVPAYVAVQMTGSLAASLVLRLLFGSTREHFFGTVPTGSDAQSLVLEFIISFYLMFVISGVATDNRAIGEVGGLAIGATVLLNVLFAGSIHEPGEDYWPGNHCQPLCQHLGVHCRPELRYSGRRMGL